MRVVKSKKCPGPGWVKVSRPCEYGKNGPKPCRRVAAVAWNAVINLPGGRRRKVLPKDGIKVCRKCAEELNAQLQILSLSMVARDGKKLARALLGAP